MPCSLQPEQFNTRDQSCKLICARREGWRSREAALRCRRAFFPRPSTVVPAMKLYSVHLARSSATAAMRCDPNESPISH